MKIIDLQIDDNETIPVTIEPFDKGLFVVTVAGMTFAAFFKTEHEAFAYAEHRFSKKPYPANEKYKKPPKHQTWDLLTAILLGVAISILAMAYFDILWR
jgi:putative Mn2+ efflux pump MntP